MNNFWMALLITLVITGACGLFVALGVGVMALGDKLAGFPGAMIGVVLYFIVFMTTGIYFIGGLAA